MKIHVSELEGAALSYAVAMAQGYKPTFGLWCGEMVACEIEPVGDFGDQVTMFYEYHKNWSQCAPLQDEFDLLVGSGPNGCWARLNPAKEETPIGRGGTRMVAICRAIVAAKLGEEVEIPDELVK